MKRTLFITGTDTGVGKTFLAAALTRYLRRRGVPVAALKPVCSGGRDDARGLCAAMKGALALDDINPWHFRAAIAPVLAARMARRRLQLAPVLAHLRARRRRFEVLVVEGAGGLLSPLGEQFNSRDLIAALRATPIIVAPNRLGVVNHVRLTLAALPKAARLRARVVLVAQPRPDVSAGTNARLLAELTGKTMFTLPWFGGGISATDERRVGAIFRELTGV